MLMVSVVSKWWFCTWLLCCKERWSGSVAADVWSWQAKDRECCRGRSDEAFGLGRRRSESVAADRAMERWRCDRAFGLGKW